MPSTDAYGRLVLSPDEAFARLYAGVSPDAMLLEPDAAKELAALAAAWDRPDAAIPAPPPLDETPEAYHARLASTWTMGEEFADIDLREYLCALCPSAAAVARVHEEMDLFAARGLEPMLRAMMALVESFRERGIVWGVGRGSSVASYVLFLLGVHKIDALAYGLSIRDFLKDD